MNQHVNMLIDGSRSDVQLIKSFSREIWGLLSVLFECSIALGEKHIPRSYLPKSQSYSSKKVETPLAVDETRSQVFWQTFFWSPPQQQKVLWVSSDPVTLTNSSVQRLKSESRIFQDSNRLLQYLWQEQKSCKRWKDAKSTFQIALLGSGTSILVSSSVPSASEALSSALFGLQEFGFMMIHWLPLIREVETPFSSVWRPPKWPSLPSNRVGILRAAAEGTLPPLFWGVMR